MINDLQNNEHNEHNQDKHKQIKNLFEEIKKICAQENKTKQDDDTVLDLLLQWQDAILGLPESEINNLDQKIKSDLTKTLDNQDDETSEKEDDTDRKVRKYAQQHGMNINGQYGTGYDMLSYYLQQQGIKTIQEKYGLKNWKEICQQMGVLYRKSPFCILPPADVEREHIFVAEEEKDLNASTSLSIEKKTFSKVQIILEEVLAEVAEYVTKQLQSDGKRDELYEKITLNDLTITEFEIEKEGTRTYPFFKIDIPWLERTIIVSDENNDATFVYAQQTGIDIKELTVLIKQELKQQARYIKFPTKIETDTEGKETKTRDIKTRKEKIKQALIYEIDETKNTIQQTGYITKTKRIQLSSYFKQQEELLKAYPTLDSFLDVCEGDFSSLKREKIHIMGKTLQSRATIWTGENGKLNPIGSNSDFIELMRLIYGGEVRDIEQKMQEKEREPLLKAYPTLDSLLDLFEGDFSWEKKKGIRIMGKSLQSRATIWIGENGKLNPIRRNSDFIELLRLIYGGEVKEIEQKMQDRDKNVIETKKAQEELLKAYPTLDSLLDLFEGDFSVDKKKGIHIMGKSLHSRATIWTGEWGKLNPIGRHPDFIELLRLIYGGEVKEIEQKIQEKEREPLLKAYPTIDTFLDLFEGNFSKNKRKNIIIMGKSLENRATIWTGENRKLSPRVSNPDFIELVRLMYGREVRDIEKMMADHKQKYKK